MKTKIYNIAAVLAWLIGIHYAAAQTLYVSGTDPNTAIAHYYSDAAFYPALNRDSDVAGGFPGQIDLTGYNLIQITWNAPVGDMYVVNQLPAGIDATLDPTVDYIGPSPVSLSLQDATATFNTVYGMAPNLTVQGNAGREIFALSADASINSATPGFAFTSLTITAGISGSGTYNYFPTIVGGSDIYFFMTLSYNEAFSDPGQNLFIEPLPVPEPSALGLLFVGASALLGFHRKKDNSR